MQRLPLTLRAMITGIIAPVASAHTAVAQVPKHMLRWAWRWPLCH